MGHTVVGVDVAASGVKVALLDASIRKLDFQRAVTHAWEAAPEGVSLEAHIAATVDAALRSQAVAGSAEMYIGLDGTKTTTRVLRFPMGDMKKIEAIFEPELEDLLARSLDDVAYTFAPLTLTRDKGELLTATAAKTDVGGLISALAATGHAPRAIYAESLTLLALAPKEHTGAIVDIGQSKTQILIMKQGKPLFSRTIREGSQRLDKAIAAAMQVDEATAKTMKERSQLLLAHEQGTGNEDKKISDAMSHGLKPLVVALKQTLHLHRAEITPGSLLLTGGGSLLLGLSRALSLELGFDAKELPLPEPLQNTPNAHVYTQAYAIAATSTQPRQPKLDFRRGEFSFRGDLRQIGRSQGRLGYAAAAIAFLAMFSGISKCVVLRADEKKLDQTLREVTKQMMGREISDFKQALVALRQSSSPEKGSLPKYSALDYFAVISQRLDTALDVKASELEMRQDKILIKGEAQSYDLVEKVVETLKGHECFKAVNLAKQRKTQDGTRVEFNLTIDLSCGNT